MSCNKQQISEQVCRMSWFLVEMDEGQSKGGNMNGRRIYKSIHSLDLVNDDPTHMFINSKVRFNWNNAVLDGRVLMAFDDQINAERRRWQLSRNKEKASKKILLQYRKRSNCVVHTFLEEEVIFPQNHFENNKVIVRDGETSKNADVLYICDSNEFMRNELDVLKKRCFDRFFQECDDSVDNSEAKYLLVQYSKSLSHVCYTVININCTLYNNLNLYPTIVVYFNEGGVDFQGIIIRKSNDRMELRNELDMIANWASTQQFPMTNSESGD